VRAVPLRSPQTTTFILASADIVRIGGCFEMLKLFGTAEEQMAAIDRHLRLVETNITMSNP